MRIKNFCNKLFIGFLLMLLVTGCGTEKITDKNHMEEETEEEQPKEIEMSKESIDTEEEKSFEEKKTDRGAESPLAVYAGEQLGREIEGCHEADYDQDGENEVIFSVEIERTDEKELDKLEIYFVDNDYEMTLIDTYEVGIPEDTFGGEESKLIWCSEGGLLTDYHGVPVYMQSLLHIESVGHGNYRHVYYGWIGKEIAKLKECDSTGYEVTTYLYDGRISDVKDKDFLKICDGNFSDVIGGEENLIENLENWYKKRGFDYYSRFDHFEYYLECDVDNDGTNELYIADWNGDFAAVFHKGEEGIECWVYDFHLALLDDGSFWHAQTTSETNGKWRKDCMTSVVIRFDSNGNQDIMDEYEKVYIHYEKNRNEEDLTIFDKYAFQSMYFYYWNGNSVTEREYLERGNPIGWY